MKTLRVSMFSRQSPYLVAQEHGYFRDAGIAVDVEAATGSRHQIGELLAGRLDIIHSNPDNIMRHRAAGHDELFAFMVVDIALGQALVVQPTVATWEDLRGQTVGTDAPDSGYALLLYEMLARHGVERGSYEAIALGSTAHRLEALRRGDVAGCLLSHHHLDAASEAGLRSFASARAFFPNHPGVVASTSRQRAEALGSALDAYVGATLAAARWAHDPANEPAVLEVVQAALGVDDDRARALLQQERMARRASVPTPSEAEDSLAVVAEVRRATTGIAPQGYFDPSYMRAEAARSN